MVVDYSAERVKSDMMKLALTSSIKACIRCDAVIGI
jgi:hypothetical protein